MDYIIITGTSRGIGKALCKQFATPGYTVIGISRTENRTLEDYMVHKGARYKFLRIDLADVENSKDWEQEIFAGLELEEGDSITLYNNAGVLGPIKHIENATSNDIIRHYNVNTVAPVLLSSAVIRRTKDFAGDKRIINISSGAAVHSYDGWACYCSSKAAINMFTQTVGVEQKTSHNPVKIIAVAPGIIDTGMQDEIRSATDTDFGEVGSFIELKANGLLSDPNVVAQKLAQLARSADFPSGAFIDIR